jgi:serine/threonine-protein kinase RsbW
LAGTKARFAHFELAPERAAGESLRLLWVDRVEELGVRLALAGGLAEEGAELLGVALREALMNALTHGASDQVSVSFRLMPGASLSITVRDRGPGFDPARLPDPRLPENVARGHGRGVFYMRHFTDEVEFSFPARGGTVARLLKRLSAVDPAPGADGSGTPSA